jgi:hypothetical protein
MNQLIAICRLIIFLFVIYLAACQKGAADLPPNSLPAGTLPDTVTVGLKSTLPIELKESSGLCSTDGAMWSFGDSGNPNAIYKIDTATGAILQAVTVANYINIDWEDITADANYIYIGDVGNNLGFRKELKILRIKKADLTSTAAQLSVNAEAINYSYADQIDFSINNNTNFNCEALIAAGDSLYIFTKDYDLLTRCYSLPKQPGTYAVSPHSTFNTGGKITAAAYNPSTKELALLGYQNTTTGSFIWFFNGYKGYNFFTGAAKKFTIGTATKDWQTEALDYISANRLMMSCEQSSSHVASLYYVQEQ